MKEGEGKREKGRIRKRKEGEERGKETGERKREKGKGKESTVCCSKLHIQQLNRRSRKIKGVRKGRAEWV